MDEPRLPRLPRMPGLAPIPRLQRVTEDDWPLLRATRLEMLADTPKAYLETVADAEARTEEEWRFRARRGSTGDANFAVAATAPGEPGRWVGYMACFVAAPGTAVLVSVYVAPPQRATGLAVRMVDTCRDWARDEARAHALTLLVHEHNARARAFYRRYGFTETGATMPYELEPTELEIEMRLPL
jgi:GNAT superfamily N-acetyltransferase